MLQQNQIIPCPICHTSIPFDAQQLIAGVRFSCGNCNASIGISVESKETVDKAMEKFESIKNKISK